MKQEVGDSLSVYVLNLLPKVSTLPRLVAVSLVIVFLSRDLPLVMRS